MPSRLTLNVMLRPGGSAAGEPSSDACAASEIPTASPQSAQLWCWPGYSLHCQHAGSVCLK
eukprot:2271755-Amphidinium_carterae.2